MRDRISLDREIGIFQKLEIDDVAGILKIDEDADFLAGFGFKGGFQQSRKAERRKNTGGNLLGDAHINNNPKLIRHPGQRRCSFPLSL